MIRQAVPADLDAVEAGYRAHFLHEKTHGAYTVFREGVYPTRADAAEAVGRGALYVYEDGGAVLGSMILDRRQPEEYARIPWPSGAAAGQTAVIHLLMVQPSAAGKGVGSALVRWAEEHARQGGCRALRLDTGAQNIPAASLYKKLGFRLAGASSMKVGGAIAHRDHLFFEMAL